MKQQENLEMILKAPQQGHGMDIVIVTTTSEDLAEFWQNRLEKTKGYIIPQHSHIFVLYEDWPGGAGNGLGTLYALVKAEEKAKKIGLSIFDSLAKGAAIGLYHTAGKGTRLAPLPGSENNNKPAVKLPSIITVGEEELLLTILEAVILQTGIYGMSRKGRVSVFWGDQVFIPSVTVQYHPTHHADILAALGPMPSAKEWKERGLNKYGLIAVASNGDAAQVEKIEHATACELIEKGTIRVDGGIGVSLGSFSMSYPLTQLLIQEFQLELQEKKIALDTDPHFWMPLTLNETTYIQIMEKKGEKRDSISKHYIRLQSLKHQLEKYYPELRIFGCVDIGSAAYWWDYGTIPNYIQNNRKLLEDSVESQAMRYFFHIDHLHHQDPKVLFEGKNVFLNSFIQKGRIKNSIVVGVVASELYCENAILINSVFSKLEGKDILLYNIVEPTATQFKPGSVRADVFHPGGVHWKIYTDMNRDGKNDWDTCLPGNPMSYAELHRTNQYISLTQSLKEASCAYRTLAEQLKGDQ